MRRWNAELERREAVRRPARLPCALWIGSDRPPSVVLHVREPMDAYLRWVDAPALGAA